uniref:uncharacterized protein LOC122599794 n=1 Tax=Erigeron canadensis TaxID=72917 RepID=UPI001CB8D369|nr:uncharacterized protein LOC122599794 [Erigeron canadensis]
MATTLVYPTTTITCIIHHRFISRPPPALFSKISSSNNRNHLHLTKIRCTIGGGGGTRDDDNSTTTTTDNDSSGSMNDLLLKTAWYASELLGIAASLFRSNQNTTTTPIIIMNNGGSSSINNVIDRSIIVDTIKQDFQRSYFVTGAVTVDAYEDDCEFADPAGSFKGVARFKRNCTNFGSLIHKSNMKLMKWQDFEDKGIGHWRFSCTMSFPWKPILSATGYTEYYLSKESGKVCRHVEHWNVPKMALFKQLLTPRRGFWSK